jgi:hypothetical protein
MSRYIEQGFVKLDSLVLDLIADNRLTTLHRYIWYLHYMIGGYQKLIMSTIPVTQRKWVKVNDAKLIDFPSDFIGLIRIGIPDGDRIRPLAPSTNLARQDEKDTPYVPKAPDGRTRFSVSTDFWTAEQFDSQMPFQGQGHNRTGYFDVNLAKRRIELSADTRVRSGDTLFLEYVADGCGELGSLTEVYYPAAEMIKQWANYRWYFYKLGANAGETRAQYQQFKEARDEYKANTSNLSADNILAAMAQTAHVGPKF